MSSEKMVVRPMSKPSPEDASMKDGIFQENNTVAPADESVLSLFSLKGKTAIVSGSGAGIGYAVVQAFAEAGANVAIWVRFVINPSCQEAGYADISSNSITATKKPSRRPKTSKTNTESNVGGRTTFLLIYRFSFICLFTFSPVSSAAKLNKN